MSLPKFSADLFRLGAWVVEPAAGTIRRGHRKEHLRPQEMDLLLFLVAHQKRVVAREELFQAIWGEVIVEEGALSRCVSIVRKALGDDARQPRYIETLPKRGYRLIAEVESLPAPSAGDPSRALRPQPEPRAFVDPPRPGLRSEIEQPTSLSSEVVGRRPEVDRSWRIRWAVAVGLLAAALLAWHVLIRPSKINGFRDSEHPVETPALPRPALPTVAVPAFKSLAPAAGHEWLAEGLAEMLATEIALSPQVELIPRELVTRWQKSRPLGTERSAVADALVLGVLGSDLVLSGAYLVESGSSSDADSVRLDLKLVDTRTGHTVAARVDDRPIAEISKLASSAGEELRRALGGDGEGVAAPGTEATILRNPEATRLYTDALSLLGRFQPAAARDKLRLSLALEPDQPYAHLALAESLSRLGRKPEAATAAAEARRLAAGLPASQRLWIEARVHGLSSRWTEAAGLYRELWNAAPANLEYGLELALSLTQGRDFPRALEAVAELKGRAGPDNRDPRIDLQEAEIARLMGEHQRAAAAARRSIAQSEARGNAHLAGRGRLILGQSLFATDRSREAREVLQRAMEAFELAGDADSLAWSHYFAGSWAYDEGNLEEAETLLLNVERHFLELGSPQAAAVAARRRGDFALERGNTEEAVQVFLAALEVFREFSDAFEQAQTLNSLGTAYGKSSAPDRATAAYTEAHALYRQTGNEAMEAATLYNIADVFLFQGRVRDAADRFDQVLSYFRDRGDDYSLAVVQMDCAVAALHLGNLQEALTAVEESRVLFERIENRRWLARALSDEALLLSELGSFTQAAESLKKGLRLREELGVPAYRVAGQASLGRLHLYSGRPEAAEAALQQALALATEAELETLDERSLLAAALLAQGRVEEARDSLRAAEENDSFGYGLGGLGRRIVSARVRSAMGEAEEAHRLLEEVERGAEIGGSWLLAMEADLALAELEILHGHADQAHARLRLLEQQARQRGFMRLAERALGLRVG